MSSDEDFSLVTEPAENTLQAIMASIANQKKIHDQLLQDQKDIAKSRDDAREMTNQFRLRSEKITQSMKDDQAAHEQQIRSQKDMLKTLSEDEIKLTKDIEKVQAALKEEEALNQELRQQSDVFTAVPQREVVFKGSTGTATKTPIFEMNPRIVYPMEGGTALITFEDKDVASNILSMRKHTVDLGDECRITVEAKPVHIMLPRLVEIDTEVCPRRILISNLPKMEAETLLMKLELHFSKSKHGGGEVEGCEMMADSWTVVLTFVEEGIAKRLAEIENHKVELQTKHKVRVTPFLNGNITNLKTKTSECPRTVLLTGIPDVMERDTMQDLLEIFFQKSTNGGGEIEAFLYNPLGEETTVVFTGASQDREDE